MSTTQGVNANAAASTTQSTTTKSDTLDKNAFMKILIAELANQDPTGQNNDPTQYVSQLAQYSSLEQMTNLNGTMTLNGASNLIGVKVQLSDTDANGNNIQGVVQSVSKNGDAVTLNVLVNGTTVQSYSYGDVITINPTTATGV
ncbi:flagellar hook capping FlgD N-terminal domain-containing protein [Clostridium akagii]|uniref:flagellar hook capping FlgD N-terminal domain-containing protein n=1 Tax=Clostridium akagii TaxID=91623 RepID=UPI00068A16C6|nr:flagellar hook capping FlgD N-terminal domain-containing protein [Clostridium akagii]